MWIRNVNPQCIGVLGQFRKPKISWFNFFVDWKDFRISERINPRSHLKREFDKKMVEYGPQTG